MAMTTMLRRAARGCRILSRRLLAVAPVVLLLTGGASTVGLLPRIVVAASGLPRQSAASAATQDRRAEFEHFMATAPRVPVIVPAEGAKVLIVRFSDYQCPICGESFLQYKPILAKYEATAPGAVRLVAKDYPLNSTCNPYVQTMMHPAACDAAAAVRLAMTHNRGAEMEEWLYTHQPSLTSLLVRQAARDVGQVTDFDAKVASALVLVRADAGLAHALGVDRTPTFFINGVKVEGAWPPQYFDQAIAYELAHAK
jgi:protein-disulfide isomerase